MTAFPSIRILDTHTGGEPTRIVLAGGPDLGGGPLAERVKLFREKHDRFRTAIVGEPRGSEVELTRPRSAQARLSEPLGLRLNSSASTLLAAVVGAPL